MKFLLLAIIIVLFVAWMMRGRVQDGLQSRQENKKLLSELDPALIAKVLFHLGTGNRIAAINELRMATGLQKAASEWLVDAIRKGKAPNTEQAQQQARQHAQQAQQPPRPGQAQQPPTPNGGPSGDSTIQGEATVVSEERLGNPPSSPSNG